MDSVPKMDTESIPRGECPNPDALVPILGNQSSGPVQEVREKGTSDPHLISFSGVWRYIVF